MTTKVAIQILIFVSVFAAFTMHQTRGDQDCYKQKTEFMQKCKNTIKRGPEPIIMEARCRKTVERDDVDMACICRRITPKDEEKVDVEKIVFIAHICHKRVPKGAKCGSKYTTLRCSFDVCSIPIFICSRQVRNAQDVFLDFHELI